MPFQHFLPAAFIANFSADNSIPRRNRLLAAGDKNDGHIFNERASNLAGENDLYTLSSYVMDPLIVDKSLSGYETSLSIAIDQLLNGEISAMTWASSLVPFVAGLMVRGPDFNVRFETRISQLGVDVGPDNTNFARLMEFQRLLAPVAAAEWIVSSTMSNEPLITSDIGYAPFINPTANKSGLVVPLDLSHLLYLVPTPRNTLAFAFGGSWHPIIEYVSSPEEEIVGGNRIMALWAQRFIFGQNIALVEKYLHMCYDTPRPLDPGQLGFVDGYSAMLHDLDWYRLISILSMPPVEDGQYIFLDMFSIPK